MLTLDQLAAALDAAVGLGAPGALPVAVKDTGGSQVEIANVVFVKGDITLTPSQASEADRLEIRL